MVDIVPKTVVLPLSSSLTSSTTVISLTPLYHLFLYPCILCPPQGNTGMSLPIRGGVGCLHLSPSVPPAASLEFDHIADFVFAFASNPPLTFIIPSQDIDHVSLYQKQRIYQHSVYHRIASHHIKLRQICIHLNDWSDIRRRAKANKLPPQPLKRSSTIRGWGRLYGCNPPSAPSFAPKVVPEARSPPRPSLPSSSPRPQASPPSFPCLPPSPKLEL